MEMLLNVLSGILIGFVIAVPVGPIDMFCIRRTLIFGPRSGFIAGLGAAVADALYGAITTFGILSMTTFLITYKHLFQFLGGLFLCAIGFKSVLTVKNLNDNQNLKVNTHAWAFFTTFFLALFSPMTILSFIGAFAVFGISNNGNIFRAILLSLGIFLGSALWWLILNSSVALFKNKLSIRNSHWINKISGLILIAFGLVAIVMSLVRLELT